MSDVITVGAKTFVDRSLMKDKADRVDLDQPELQNADIEYQYFEPEEHDRIRTSKNLDGMVSGVRINICPAGTKDHESVIRVRMGANDQMLTLEFGFGNHFEDHEVAQPEQVGDKICEVIKRTKQRFRRNLEALNAFGGASSDSSRYTFSLDTTPEIFPVEQPPDNTLDFDITVSDD